MFANTATMESAAMLDFNNAPTSAPVDPVFEFGQLIGCSEIIGDGEIHRYGDKLAQWYVLFVDPDFAAGAYGDWRDDSSHTWCSKNPSEFSVAERVDFEKRIQTANEKKKKERELGYLEASREALRVWGECKKKDIKHPYLDSKKIRAYGRIGLSGDKLIIPIQDHNGSMVSYQKIFPNGTKRFLPKGRKGSCYFRIDGGSTTYICEGYATGATIHEATGATVIVAFDAGNIVKVAKLFPSATVACDNDQFKPDVGNIGVKSGLDSGLPYIVPKFRDLSTKPTDFNDLACLEGIEEVRRQLLAASSIVTLKTADELFNMEFTDQPIIKGILDKGESLLVVGRSGLGKSLLTLELALRICSTNNQRLFNEFAIPEPQRVLIIQSENTASATNKRLKKMVEYDPDLRGSLKRISIPFIHNDIRLPGYFTDAQFRQQVVDLIKECGATVVLIDPLISYHSEDENDNAAMRRSLDLVTHIQDLTQTTVILVHHMGKAAGQQQVFAGRGASAIGDWAANIWVMHDAGRGVVRLEHYKQRNHEKHEDLYLVKSEGLTFERTQDPNKSKELKAIDIVVEALEDLGGVVDSKADLYEKMLDWEEELGTISRATGYRLIDKALKYNRIVTKKDGKKCRIYVSREEIPF